jgi:hypothetical protein
VTARCIDGRTWGVLEAVGGCSSRFMHRRREGGGPERSAIAPLPVIKLALRRSIMVSQQCPLPKEGAPPDHEPARASGAASPADRYVHHVADPAMVLKFFQYSQAARLGVMVRTSSSSRQCAGHLKSLTCSTRGVVLEKAPPWKTTVSCSTTGLVLEKVRAWGRRLCATRDPVLE